jgi:hypothetical protein
MDEIAKLIETLRGVERLFDGATTPGERVAAGYAKERLDARLQGMMEDSPIEMKFSLQNGWSRKLFTTLARKYQLEPFRYYRQRRTTVMLRVTKKFCDEVLWPEFIKLDDILMTHLDEITDRVVREAIHNDASEVVIRQQLLAVKDG